MFIGLDSNNQRIHALKADKTNAYHCPICQQSLTLRAGEIRCPHFAHKNSTCPDTWSSDMSEWHIRMQNMFPIEQQEVVVERGGELHRADVLVDNCVLEFQHSPISPAEISERNAFYLSCGYKVAWVFDVSKQYQGGLLNTHPTSPNKEYHWLHPYSCFRAFPLPQCSSDIFLHLYWQTKSGEELISRIVWTEGNEHISSLSNFYLAPYSITLVQKSGRYISKPGIEQFFLTAEPLQTAAIEKEKSYYASLRIKEFYINSTTIFQEHRFCPKRNAYGIKYSGPDSCYDCRSCALIEEFPERKFYFKAYCCYPQRAHNVPTYNSCSYTAPIFYVRT